MANQAGPARAAGKPGPPLQAGRPSLAGVQAAAREFGPRRVRIETRTGSLRTKKGAPTPPVHLELGAEERLLHFYISERPGPGLLASIEARMAFDRRKTTDWDWEATVEVNAPHRKPAARRKKGSS